ncbi:MAG: hypothetical protein QME60_03460 [Verrucomicrobiota bacterium]|nr:hypothetical protein [Verrucomicrobiota bacterium]
MSRTCEPAALRGAGRLLLFLLSVPGLVGCASTAICGEFDLGFLACKDTDLRGRVRLRAAGPFFERTRAADGGGLLAVRPLYARTVEPERDRVLHEFAWPAAMVRRMGHDTFWRALIFYGNDYDNTRADSRRRVNLFPLVFWGRDSAGQGYFALFPLGGTIREDFMRERVSFALFPLYFSHTSARGVESRSILWPLATWSWAPGFSQQRFVPFYSRSVEEGKSAKHFILFPLWTRAQYFYPESHGYSYMLFPLCGRVNMNDQQTWWILPPFFRYATNRAGYAALNCPWPILQYRAGDIDRLYIWPLWGKERDRNTRSWFFLWPVARWSETIRGDWRINRFFAVPFVYHASVVRASEEHASATEASASRDAVSPASPDPAVGERAGSPANEAAASPDDRGQAVKSRDFRLWPMLSCKREDDVARYRMPELWPAGAAGGVDRAWAPFWTLYSRDRSGDALEDELLWGLFRYRRDSGGARKLSLFPLFCYTAAGAEEPRNRWSVLLGLLGYEQEGSRRTLRLLYCPLRWESGPGECRRDEQAPVNRASLPEPTRSVKETPP